MKLRYDLHLHSALSPCGEERMTPNNIVNMALIAGLNIIALTDHNTCGNCRAAMAVGEQNGLVVIPGMELTTAEDAHVVCLFPTADDAERFEAEVAASRILVKNDPNVFGRQLRMDAEDRIVGEEEHLLILATQISAYDVQAMCRRHGGVAIPAHINKDSYSLLASLGYLDPEMHFPICEVTLNCDTQALLAAHPELQGVSFLRSSDAHDLGYIGIGEETLELPEASAAAVIRCFAGVINGENR